MTRRRAALTRGSLVLPSFKTVGSTTTITNTSTAVTLPTVVDGDLMLGFSNYKNGASVTAQRTPTGWTAVDHIDDTADGCTVVSKVASSEPSSYTGWTFGTSTPSTTIIATFGNAAVISSSTSSGSVSSGTIIAPSVTVTAGQMIVRLFEQSIASTGGSTPATGYTEIIDNTATARGIYVAYRVATVSGATGTETFPGAGSGTWKAITLVLG